MNKKIIYVVVGIVVVVVAASLLTDGVLLGPKMFGKRAVSPIQKEVAPGASDSPLQPTIVLDIPEPSQGIERMDPSPVFASIDFDASNSGAGDWSQTRILWKVERDGGINDITWPRKYRYVTDPRPGIDESDRDVDLSGQQFDSGDYRGPRGFNMGWLLTEGNWTITAIVTNINGETVEVSSGEIEVVANARTPVYVNSSNPQTGDGSQGNPYQNLTYAFSQKGSIDDIEYVIAGGHDEIVIGDREFRTRGGNNCWIHWDEIGIRPVFRTVDLQTTRTFGSVSSVGEVWEGFDLVPGVNVPKNDDEDQIAIAYSGDFNAFIDLHISGETNPGNRFYSFFGVKGRKLLTQGIVGGISGGYAYPTASSSVDVNHIVIMGNTLSGSDHESIIRVVDCKRPPIGSCTSVLEKVNIMYTDLINDESKSTIRFQFGDYMHVYGSHLRSGDFRYGSQLGTGHPKGKHPPLDHSRIEANHFDGKTQRHINFLCDVHDGSIINNVFMGDEGNLPNGPHSPAMGGGFNCVNEPGYDPSDNVKIASNTAFWSVEGAAPFKFGSTDGGNVPIAVVEANLIHFPVNRSYPPQYQMLVDTWVFHNFKNNVWTPRGDYGGGKPISTTRHGKKTIDEWNNDFTFTENEQAISTTLNAIFVPDPMTNVSTPDGVYDDYYGSPRGAISAAGAVTKWAPECGVDGDCVPGECQTNGQCVDSICVYTNVDDGTSCDNGLYCDGTETCQAGSCVGSGNPCLTDFACIEGICDEGEDFCSLFYNHAYCDDSNQCTEDSCTGSGPEGCSHNILVDSPCDDGDSCTENDICTELELQGVGTVGVCGGSMITQCNNITSDGCCPVGCDDTNDNDCSSCGNGFEFGGMCWFAGELGESCDTVCAANGKSCVQDNWNDDASCTVCMHYFPGATNCIVVNNNFMPAYKIGNNVCRYRGTVGQTCDSSNSLSQRLCVCE